MSTTDGKIAWQPGMTARTRGWWNIEAKPHVMVRVKRLFGRVQTHRSGVVSVTDAPEVCRDIEWLMQRYTFDIHPSALEHLTAQSDTDRAKAAEVQRLLGGGTVSLADDRPLARTPRPYQESAASMVLATGRVLCTDPLGAGKTMSGILTFRGEGALPALVVTLAGKMPQQWCDEVAKTMPWLRTHVVTSTTPYDPTMKRGVTEPPDVLVMNYAKVAGWADHLAGIVRTVIFDEAQELRHAGTDKYTAAAQVADGARYRMALSNTPIYGYGGEAYNVISVIAPDLLGSREEFQREWCQYLGNGKWAARDPAALGGFLRDNGVLLDRKEDELGIVLPPAERSVVHVDTDPAALEAVRGDAQQMARLLLDEHSNPWTRKQAAGQLDLRLRQATGIAKAPYVAEYVRFLLATEPRVLLYGWHRTVYDIWRDLLEEFNPVMYTGSESTTQKRKTFEAFTGGKSRLLIMSLRSGAGIDGLQGSCRDVVFGELDWAPNVHKQAVGRLRRSGMDVTRPVRAHYLVADEGSDPEVASAHGLKSAQHDLIFERDVQPMQAKVGMDPDRMKALARSVLGQDAPAGRTA